MEIINLISHQLEIEKQYDEKRTILENKIAKMQKELKDMKYPHWSNMLSNIIMELNNVIADRGYQFETDNYYIFGMDPSISVFQDLANSSKFANSYLRFIFNDTLFCYDEKQLVKITSLEDIVRLIDKQEKIHNTIVSKYLKDFGIDELKSKILCGKMQFEDLPENEQSEDFLIQYANSEKARLESIPAGMITYTVLKTIIQQTISGSEVSNRLNMCLNTIFEYQYVINLLDTKLFPLALEAGVRLYRKLPMDMLYKLGAFQYDTIMLGIKNDPEAICVIPENIMKDDYIVQFVNHCIYADHIDWTKIKGLNNISQETVDLLIEKYPIKAFSQLLDKFKTLELCHKVLKIDRSLKQYVPKQHLTANGNIKRLPKSV